MFILRFQSLRMRIGTIAPKRLWNRNIITTGASVMNRLGQEKSPYLLQHAHNPIDWYPWGDEAISKAKAEDKVIFLSVGYATCHWCHVMEKESFESTAVAAIMNKHFVAIKVDREERPDLDKIYMTFLLLVNKSGGWPMSIWLTPDLAPITAGTYFPPESRWGMPGFKMVLQSIADKWQTNRSELTSKGKMIIEEIQATVKELEPADPDRIMSVQSKFDEAVKIFKFTFDRRWGGFNRSPKFPECSKLNFLLHGYLQTQDSFLLDAVTSTLDHIIDGGIHDHVFGGFSRYSVDQKWHIPHFEKMLYDQGQLLIVMANAYKLTKNEKYRYVCEKTFTYLTTDLIHALGGFFSGEDADSFPTLSSDTKIEGSFYAWTYEEVQEAFEEAQSQFPAHSDPYYSFNLFCHHFGIEVEGNVRSEDDPHGHLTHKNILMVRGSVTETAEKFKCENVQEILRVGCQVLYERRKTRPRPELDTKLICAWNALILSGISELVAISDAGILRAKYLQAATTLVEFIKTNFYNEQDNTLKRSCYGDADKLAGARQISGFLDDYAFLVRGLLHYYNITLDKKILEWAKNLQDTQNRLFLDETNGGYYYSQANSPNVVIRLKEDHDGAEPTGNSVAVTNLLQLAVYFEDESMEATAQKCIDYFRSTGSLGYAMPKLLSGALLHEHGNDMVVVVGPKTDASEKLLDVVRKTYIPGLVLFHLDPEDLDSVSRDSVKLFKMIDNSSTAYLCHNKVCRLPLTDAEQLREALAERLRAE